MKGLKKVALASAIAAVSAGAQAELKALDDATMGELTGQAGLTIDIETKFSIGEFQYRDQDPEAGAAAGGSVLIRNITEGGSTVANYAGQTSSFLDNVRLTLDVAGSDPADNASLNYGFSEIGRLSAFLANPAIGNTDPNIVANATAAAEIAAGSTTSSFVDFGTTAGFVSGAGNATEGTTGTAVVQGADLGVGQWAAGLGSAAQGTENGSDVAGVEDGDLVIHFGFTDAFAAGGGFGAFLGGVGSTAAQTGTASLANITWEEARDVATRAVDYSFSIEEIALADSTYVVGSGDTTGTTTLISDLSISGYFGPADLHIENDGNGFGADGSAEAGALASGATASGNADSKITWGSYFRITDLEVYIAIAGISLEGVQIHNARGDQSGLDGTSSFGFAHSRRTIYAVEEAVLGLGEAGSAASGSAFYKSGLALNTEFKGDIDIDALRFGGVGETEGGDSIGQIYLTDIESTTNWTISAH